jgi:two-component system sensor histidine kinase/response regulator
LSITIDEKTPYNGVIIDMFMLGMSGSVLAENIRNNHTFDQISLVLMTLLQERGDDAMFNRLGVCDYFPKPVTAIELFGAITAIQKDAGGSIQNKHFLKEKKPEKNYSWPENIRILLVEDNQVNKIVALSLLELFNLSADLANSGLEALDALKRSPSVLPYQLVLMDCQMPLMDRYEASQRIRAGEAGGSYSNIPIIALTANAMK